MEKRSLGGRTKVTLACSTCRKRRAKCNGVRPCDVCKKHGSECSFDAQQAKRRGPRPRTTQTGIVTSQKLAPAPARGPILTGPPSSVRPALAGTGSDKTQGKAVQAERHGSGGHDGNVPFTQDSVFVGATLLHEDDEDDQSDPQEIPCVEQWQQCLQSMLEKHAVVDSAWSVNLAAHLLELFWKAGSASLRTMIDQNNFFNSLIEGAAASSLILALCAAAVKYSCHPSVRRQNGRTLLRALEKTCRSCLTLQKREVAIRDIQALCVLADLATSDGAGAQAWVDLGHAKSLLQICRANGSCSSSHQESLTRLEEYLAVAELVHALGYPTLNIVKSPLLFTFSVSRTKLLHDLLDLCQRIYALNDSPLTLSDPAPWTSLGTFKMIQEDLEDFAMKHTAEFQVDACGDISEPDEHLALRSSCVLMWHCCSVMLNRHFLPVPEASLERHADLPQRAWEHNFPFAPILYVSERSSVCLSSVAAICALARDLVEDRSFLLNTPFIGFALFNSGLVLLNELHGLNSAKEDAGIVENLKVVFTILGALRNIYAPAHAWIRTLFHAHDKRNLRQVDETSQQSVFGSFIKRFDGIDDIGMVSLWTPDVVSPTDQQARAEQTMGVMHSDPWHSKLGNVNKRQDNAWMQDYATYLDADIAGGPRVAHARASESNMESDNSAVHTSSGINGLDAVATSDAGPRTQDRLMQLAQPAIRSPVFPTGIDQLQIDGLPDFLDTNLQNSHHELMNHLVLGDQFWVDWTNSDMFSIPDLF